MPGTPPAPPSCPPGAAGAGGRQQGASPRYGSADHPIAGSETHSLGTVYLEYIRGYHWGFWGCHWATGGVATL